MPTRIIYNVLHGTALFMLNCRTVDSKTAKHKENNGEEESLCRKNTKA